MPEDKEFDKDKFFEACRTAGPMLPEDKENLRQMLQTKSLQRAFSELFSMMDNTALKLLAADFVSETGRASAIKTQGVAAGITQAVEYLIDSAFTKEEN